MHNQSMNQTSPVIAAEGARQVSDLELSQDSVKYL